MIKVKEKKEEVSLMAKPLEEQGITGTKADIIKKAFLPMVKAIEEIEDEYQGIISMERDEFAAQKARDLRLRLVKMRTGVNEIHKEQKAESLRYGRAIDGVKNVYEFATMDKEGELLKIEKHAELVEKERLDKIEEARKGLLEEFPDVNFNGYDLRNMEPAAFRQLLADQHELKEIRERRAQEEAEAAEKLKIKNGLTEFRKNEMAPFIPFVDNFFEMDLGELSELEYDTLINSAENAKFIHDEHQRKIEQENTKLKEQADKSAKQAADREAQIKVTQELQNTRLAEILPFNDPKKNLIDLSKLWELSSEDYHRILTNKKEDWQKSQDEAKAIADKQAAEKAEAEKETARLVKELADKQAAEEAEIKKKAEEDAAAEEAKKKAAIAPDKDKLKLKVNELKYELSVLSGVTASNLDIEIKTKFAGFQKWAIGEIDKI